MGYSPLPSRELRQTPCPLPAPLRHHWSSQTPCMHGLSWREAAHQFLSSADESPAEEKGKESAGSLTNGRNVIAASYTAGKHYLETSFIQRGEGEGGENRYPHSVFPCSKAWRRGCCSGGRHTARHPSTITSTHRSVLSPFAHSCPTAVPHRLTSPAASSKPETLIPNGRKAPPSVQPHPLPLEEPGLSRSRACTNRFSPSSRKQYRLPDLRVGLAPLRDIIQADSGRTMEIPFSSAPPQAPSHPLLLFFGWEQQP